MKKQLVIRISKAVAVSAFAVVSFVSYRAYAAAACGNCLVTSIFMSSGNWAWIGTGLNMASSCASGSNDNYMAVDVSTDKGKAVLALAQSAFLAGRSVDMAGTNSCTGTGGPEQLSTLWVR